MASSDAVAWASAAIAAGALVLSIVSQVQLSRQRKAYHPVPKWKLGINVGRSPNSLQDGERVALWCELTNVGDGSALDVQLDVHGDDAELRRIEPNARVSAGVLAAGESIVFYILVHARDLKLLGMSRAFNRETVDYKIENVQVTVTWYQSPDREKMRSRSLPLAESSALR